MLLVPEQVHHLTHEIRVLAWQLMAVVDPHMVTIVARKAAVHRHRTDN
jgi:hypothetical protein